MSNESGLAAVHAAAGAISASEHEAAVARARTEGHAAGRTEGETAGRTAGQAEGAAGERARIVGIEAHAKAMPGHDALVAEMKADGKTTPDQAAGRILAAEGALRANAAQGVRDVEAVTGAVAAAPASRPAAAVEQASTPEGWKAEFAKSSALQAEFGEADTYVAYKAGVAGGNVRLLSRKSA